MEKKKRFTYWYVKPLDPFTNEAIVRELTKTADAVETMKLTVGDSTVRDLYEVPHYNTIAQLFASGARYSFKVYRKQGSYGTVIEWKFGNKQQAKKAKGSPKKQK